MHRLSSQNFIIFSFVVFFLCAANLLIDDASAQEKPVQPTKEPNNIVVQTPPKSIAVIPPEAITQIKGEIKPKQKPVETAKPKAKSATPAKPKKPASSAKMIEKTASIAAKNKEVEAYDISKNVGLASRCQSVIHSSEGKKYDERAFGLCFGYFQGVINSYQLMNAYTKKGKICLPKDGTWLQYIENYLRWNSKNPEFLQGIAWSGVVKSLSESYPCSTNQ